MKQTIPGQISFAHDPGKTQQGFKSDCDVNRIVKHFTETGLPPPFMKTGSPHYGFAAAQTFTEAMHIVSKAQSEFASLPSKVRSHFDNDPVKFLDAAGDDDRRDEFIKLGLLPEPAAEAVTAPLTPPEEAIKDPPEKATPPPN